MAQTARHRYQVLTKRPERLLEFYAWNYQGVSDAEAQADWLGSFGHIWFGVTVENRHFTSRIEKLRQLPALVRFLSVEPLLEDIGALDLTGISWVIIGGESGPGSRPFHIQWARNVIHQCRSQHVAPFMKQVGKQPMLEMLPMILERDRGHGGDPLDWPEDIRVREFPAVPR
jgi:protein gp37